MTRILTLVLLLVSTGLLSAQTHVPPQQREGAEHANDAQRFFERMHSVPDGYNWRLVNRAVRDARVERLRKGANDVQDGHISVRGQWRELGSNNQCGRIINVDYDPETERVWVAGAGGTIWAGDVNGSSWRILNETQQIDYPKLVKHVDMPDGTTRLIALANTRRFYTLDEGQTIWEQADGTESWQRWGGVTRAVACTRNGRLEIYAVGGEWDYGEAWKGRSSVWRSIDSGRTYERVRWFDGNRRTLWTDGTDNVLLIHGDTLSSIEPDGAVEQITVTEAWSTGNRGILMAGTSMEELIVAAYDGSETTFHLSDDRGESWFQSGVIDIGPFHNESFGRTTDDSQTWIYGGVEAWRSQAYGDGWQKINSWPQYYPDPENKLHADIPAIVSFTRKDGTGLTFICTDGGIYTSTDGGATVRNISLNNLNTAQYYGSYTHRDNVDVVGAGAQDQGFQRSQVDNGVTPMDFDQLISGDYARLVSGDQGRTLWCVYPGFTLYWPNFENGGARVGEDFVHTRGMWLPPLAVDPRNPQEVFLGGGRDGQSGTRVYRYRYTGNALSVDHLDQEFGTGGTQVTAITIHQGAPDNWYVVTTAGEVWASTTGGTTWTTKQRPNGLNGHYFGGNALAMDPRFPSTLFIGGQGYEQAAVWMSADGADTWTALEGLPPCLVLGLDVSDDGRLVAAATDVGAFVYDTQEGVWTDITVQGGPDQNYWHVEWVPQLRQFRFSTYGRGLWAFTPGGFTSVDERQAPSFRLQVDGVLTPRGGAVRITPEVSGTATLTWYDLDGRQLLSQVIDLRGGSQLSERPASVPAGSMVVVVDADGRVGGAVVP